jgi:hypothetical protein
MPQQSHGTRRQAEQIGDEERRSNYPIVSQPKKGAGQHKGAHC